MTAAPMSTASAPGARRNTFGSYGTLSACPPYVHIIKDEGSSVCRNRHISGGGPPRAGGLRVSDRLDGSSRSGRATFELDDFALRRSWQLPVCAAYRPSMRQGQHWGCHSQLSCGLLRPALVMKSGGPSETWKVRVTNVVIAEML